MKGGLHDINRFPARTPINQVVPVWKGGKGPNEISSEHRPYCGLTFSKGLRRVLELYGGEPGRGFRKKPGEKKLEFVMAIGVLCWVESCCWQCMRLYPNCGMKQPQGH